ncbi:MAG: YifB family Mg chelatase-like AAA ATPase [Pseudomonadales bacterium]|nr:YifB family Mg chelatase-like AAA ATPase [Pseudomonadales bacterium]
MDAPRVIVETHLAGGLPGTTLVGLPATAVREARDRVRSALQNCGFDYPRGKVIINLAPADLAKEGGRFDLAIAISILRATGQFTPEAPRTFDYEFLGELSLNGELRYTRGCLCAALHLDAGDRLVVPWANLAEARLARDQILPVGHLQDVVNLLRMAPAERDLEPTPPSVGTAVDPAARPQVADPIIGQSAAKRAIAVAAVGGHHLLLIGPPGAGKSLLSRRLPLLLPSLDTRRAMEVAAVYSAAGLSLENPSEPPIRDPHHSASMTAMVGGGSQPRPGEISLAHQGVLFLDELPHFKPSVLDALREPLENRRIAIARATGQVAFPANFQLIAAMNPCPAGLTCEQGSCRCRPDQVQRYQSRISGPLLDRVDLHVGVPEVPGRLLLEGLPPEAEAHSIREQIAKARRIQITRQRCFNSELPVRALERLVTLDAGARRMLDRAMERYRLSARGLHRVLRVARSIADLESAEGGESTQVGLPHLAEALSYRGMEWSGKGAAH